MSSSHSPRVRNICPHTKTPKRRLVRSGGTSPYWKLCIHFWNRGQPWITPSIFEDTNNSDIIDEYTFGQLQDSEHALSILQDHWETWITEDDFAAIKAAGLNHVRYVINELWP